MVWSQNPIYLVGIFSTRKDSITGELQARAIPAAAQAEFHQNSYAPSVDMFEAVKILYHRYLTIPSEPLIQ